MKQEHEHLKQIPLLTVCLLTSLFVIPEIWLAHTHPWYEPIVSVVISTITYGAFVFTFFLLLNLIEKKTGQAVSSFIRWALIFVASAYFISQSFLWFCFKRHWDYFTLQLIKEATHKECMEFITTFVTSPAPIFLTSITIFLIVSISILSKRYCLYKFPGTRAKQVTLSIFLFACFSQLYFISSDDAATNYERASGWPFKRTALFNIRQSVLQMKEFEEENNRCAHQLSLYDNRKDSIPANSPDIVLIIGESYNRNHSSLYGYYLPTSPLLQSRQNGNLFVFNDVIAPTNGTSDCFKLLMSMASANNDKRWCDKPLLPAMFKKNGWNTILYSNQFVCEENLQQWDASMGFINHPTIGTKLFTHRNHLTYDYDMQLIDDYASHKEELEAEGNNFVVFHLYGQHINAYQRFPASETHFHTSDIKRPDLNDDQKQIIADYDNATLYNDKVVDKIMSIFGNRNAIIIYLSDHGEEIYDFRNQYGRTDLEKDVDKALAQQLEIPFIVYLTDDYILLHPDKVKIMSQATNKPFMTDDLPHFILDMIDAKSPWLDRNKSIISQQYVPHKRFIYNTRRVYAHT